MKSLIDWVRDLDFGSVPAWLSAWSLLLAYRIFRRDRSKGERSQIDLLGIWMRPSWDMRMPGERLVDEITITRYARNGSELPIDIVQLAYEVTTRWLVPAVTSSKEAPVHVQVEGTGSLKFSYGPLRIAPGDTWSDEADPQKVPIANLAPKRAASLDFLEGVAYGIRWALVSDNAGRRWIVRPGRPTTPLRWFSRRRRDYPVDWQRRHTRAVRRFPRWLCERWLEWRAKRQLRP